MLKKYIIQLLLCFLFGTNTYAQISTTIPLVREISKSSFGVLGCFTDKYIGNRDSFKGIPSYFTEKNSIIKTLYFGRNSIIKDSIFLIIGNINKQQVCIIDGNNNKNFSDDFLYSSSDSSNATFPAIPISICFNYAGKNIKKNIFVTPNFNSKGFQFNDSIEREYFVTIVLSEYRVGVYKVGNKSIYITALLNHFYPIYDSETVFLISRFSKDTLKNITPQNSYKLGEYYSINDSEKIRIAHIDINGDSLCLERSETKYGEKIIGNKVDFYAPPIKTNDVNNRLFTLNYSQNNYTVIDFWGTWCKPCVDAIPHLRYLHNKYSHLRIISIACEGSSFEIAKKFIVKNKMNWTNLYDFFKGDQALIKSFNVNTFPSLFLIDPQGKIIYRGNNDDGFMDKLLKKIYKY